MTDKTSQMLLRSFFSIVIDWLLESARVALLLSWDVKTRINKQNKTKIVVYNFTLRMEMRMFANKHTVFLFIKQF